MVWQAEGSKQQLQKQACFLPLYPIQTTNILGDVTLTQNYANSNHWTNLVSHTLIPVSYTIDLPNSDKPHLRAHAALGGHLDTGHSTNLL